MTLQRTLHLYKWFYALLYETECTVAGMPETREEKRQWIEEVGWDTLTQVVYNCKPESMGLQMLTKEQAGQQMDRALGRVRQYRRSWRVDPRLIGCLGQLAGHCAFDRETGEQLECAITRENIFFAIGESVDILRLIQSAAAKRFDVMAKAVNTAVLQYKWTNQQILELESAGKLRAESHAKLKVNIRMRSMDPKVLVGGSKPDSARILLSLVDPKGDGTGDGGVEPCALIPLLHSPVLIEASDSIDSKREPKTRLC